MSASRTKRTPYKPLPVATPVKIDSWGDIQEPDTVPDPVENSPDPEPEILQFDSFDDMGLNENLLRGIYAYGFETPSVIQSKAIPTIITGRDVVAQAQSGTGKTGAFVISMLQMIDPNISGVQGLIMSPTRELAIQTFEVCKNICKYMDVYPLLCVGGTDIIKTRNDISRGGPIIIIGTTGRIIDMMQRRYLGFKDMKLLIIDEADEMLSFNFTNQVKAIISEMSSKVQICIFSATMPMPVLELTEKFMNKPINILVKTEALTLEGIQQFYIDAIEERNKFDYFCYLYEHISVSQSIIYVNRKGVADELKDRLEEKNYTVSVIHSGLSPNDREHIMRNFRSGITRILISTDLLSRGIDVQQVSVVINYELPHMNNKESYIHRIGRSGRYGRKGVAINIISEKDYYKLEELEKFYQTHIQALPKNINDILF